MKTVECPHCHFFNAVPMAGIGQYVTCQQCHCKYYVYVPPLADEQREPAVIETPSLTREAVADEVAVERQGGGNVMIRQESLLATIHEDLVDLRRRLTIACFLFVVGCSAVIATFLLR